MSSAEKPAKRGRKPREVKPVEAINEAAFEQDAQALIVHQQQAAEVLSKVGYDEPYDRERVVSEARFYMGQSATAMLEAGRRLVVLKACEPHGTFIDIVENRLGMALRTAQVMMQAATKYLSSPSMSSNAQALAHLGSTKLLELMTVSDEDLTELADGGTLAGYSQDDIDRMSTRELKVALREAREEAASKDELLDKKNKTIDRMAAQQKRIKKLPPDEALAELQREAQGIFNDARGLAQGSLRQALLALSEHEGDNTIFMAGLAGQLKNDITALQLEFGLPDIEAGQLADMAWLSLTPEEIKAQTQAEYGEKLAALKAAKSGEASKE